MPYNWRSGLAILVATIAAQFAGMAQGATRNYDLGDRLTAFALTTHDGSAHLLTFERPTIVVLWASWSPASLTALSEIVKGAPQGGIRWQLLPINVDAPSLNSNDTTRVNSAARSAGWNGTVLHDSGYSLMDQWGVMAVPTVVFTGMGGTIDELLHDWSPVARDRLFTLYFGAITDSFPGMTEPEVTTECRSRAERARRLWRLLEPMRAIDSMRAVQGDCSGLPNDAARLVDWLWSEGDSLRSRTGLDSLLGEEHQNAWVLCVQGALAARNGECSTAVDLCRHAVARDSAFFPAWIQLGECLWQLSDSSGAFRAYERARLLNRLDARVLALGARLAEARDDDPEAARLMRAAVEARMRQRRF